MTEKAIDTDGATRAALLLMTLGETEAAEVLRYMNAAEVQRVGAAMASLKDVSKDEASNVLDGFITEFEQKTSFGIAAEDYIRKVLTNAFSESKAESLIQRMLIDEDARGFESLQWMTQDQIEEIIDGEHPQIVAIIVSYLEPERAAAIVAAIPDEKRSEVVKRIAQLTDVQQTALAEIEELIASKSSGVSKNSAKKVGGTRVAAAIVNALGTDTADEVLEKIKQDDDGLAKEIEEQMFVFESLLNVDDRGIQALLREISNDLLVVALKGALPEMQTKIVSNMSKRAATLLTEDIEARGPTRLSEVEQAQKEILEVARRLADSGDLDLGQGGEEYV